MSVFVIAYDVSDDRRRSRLASLLSRYGSRLQLSVFECELQPEQFSYILAEAEQLLEPSDLLHAFPQCGVCLEQRGRLGPARSVVLESYYII